MLKERIRTYCGNGDNCSQVILRAVAEEYGISLSEELFCACRGIHGGFGINGMCSGIVAGVMALGLLCGGGVEAETDSVSSSGTESIRQSGLLYAFGSGRGLQRRFGGNRRDFTGGDRRIKGRKQSQLLSGFLLEHMQG